MYWTRTVAGKTQTRTLTQEQAQRYQPWFDNARRLRNLITELEARSLRAFHDAEGLPVMAEISLGRCAERQL